MRRAWAARCAALVFGAMVASGAAGGMRADDWAMNGFSVHYMLFRSGSPPGVWDPARTRVCAETLELTEDQRDTLDAMILDADREMAQEWIRRQELELDQRLGDPALKEMERKELESGAYALRELSDRLVATIEQDLELLLSPEQAPRWARVAPTMRREVMLVRNANLDMEPREVGALVAALDLPEDARAKLAPMVEHYRADLDALIVSRERAIDVLEDAIEDAGLIERNDPYNRHRRDQAEQDYTKVDTEVAEKACAVVEQSERISGLNTRTLDLIRAELDDAARQRLDVLVRLPTEFTRRSYAVETDAHRAFRAVDTLSTRMSALSIAPVSEWYWGVGAPRNTSISTGQPLTRSQEQDVDALRESFEKEFAELLVRLGDPPPSAVGDQYWVQVRSRSGTVNLRRNDQNWRPPDSGEAQRRTQLREATNELTLRTLRELRNILTPEQRVAMSCWVQ